MLHWAYVIVIALVFTSIGFLVASQMSVNHYDEIIEELLEEIETLKDELEELKKSNG